MGTPLGPKFNPYTYMDPLGNWVFLKWGHLGGLQKASPGSFLTITQGLSISPAAWL